ncbi:MAG: MerR family transcriptional regulator [Clostridiales bacterium]|nr:MerR family transcriptional regulator [Clostridiales bacterium]
MAEVRNCKRCGKIFTYGGGTPICQTCKQQDEDDFKRVKDYLWDNPKATLSEVSGALDITAEKIKRFLKDGRLEIISEDGNMFLECEKCGKAIKSGRFCEDCERNTNASIKNLASELNSAVSAEQARKEEEARKAIGMRYLNKDK